MVVVVVCSAHSTCVQPARNNSLDNFWYSDALTPVNNCDSEGCIVDEATVFNVSGHWPPAAQVIIAAAGARY